MGVEGKVRREESGGKLRWKRMECTAVRAAAAASSYSPCPFPWQSNVCQQQSGPLLLALLRTQQRWNISLGNYKIAETHLSRDRQTNEKGKGHFGNRGDCTITWILRSPLKPRNVSCPPQHQINLPKGPPLYSRPCPSSTDTIFNQSITSVGTSPVLEVIPFSNYRLNSKLAWKNRYCKAI